MFTADRNSLLDYFTSKIVYHKKNSSERVFITLLAHVQCYPLFSRTIIVRYSTWGKVVYIPSEKIS